MADVNETLVKEAIRKASQKAEEEKKAAEDAEAESEEINGDPSAGDSTETPESDEVGNNEETEDPDDAGDEAEGDEPDGDSEDGSKKHKKSGIFGKKNKKDPRDEKIEELNDRLLRNLAEFENFRKRTDKEKSQMFEIGAKSIIERILPAIDSFERGLKSISEEDKESPLAQGMEKIYKQLMDSLTEAGLAPIEAVGAEFDPNLHNAVMHEDNEELGENIVSEELQKGYTYHDSVVRHSMVKVAN